jgi:hypothetical protein
MITLKAFCVEYPKARLYKARSRSQTRLKISVILNKYVASPSRSSLETLIQRLDLTQSEKNVCESEYLILLKKRKQTFCLMLIIIFSVLLFILSYSHDRQMKRSSLWEGEEVIS